MKTLWKIVCKDDRFPGMWQRWFKNQCVAVGWPPTSGYKLDERHYTNAGWNIARQAIKEMKTGDMILVTLQGNKIGRLGEIVGKAIEDDQWDPLVPVDRNYPYGEIGRRVFVRWELTTGPDDPDIVIQLPKGHAFTFGELRPTIKEIRSKTINQVRRLMNAPSNWVGLLSKFGSERGLSDYIAAYPHHLEDGLLPHPNKKIREQVFKDKTRSDVLLIDRDENPVVVECKQHPASAKHIRQLRGYTMNVEKLSQKKARGILVHAGAQKLPADVIREANRHPKMEIVCYRLRAEFTRSTA